MSNPWMKFYPSDWRSDPNLRLCSRAARGTWIDMLTIMHEAEPYGELRVNGVPLDAKGLAKLLGESVEDIAYDISELEKNGVLSRRKNGVIYSRRMEKDENLRRKMRENGKKGGLANIRNQREKQDLLKQKPKPQKPEARDQSISNADALECAREISPPVDPPEKNNGRARGAARATRIQTTWNPTPMDYAFAGKEGLSREEINREADKFRDYWLAQPASKARKTDWSATWRNWIRRSIETRQPAHAASNGRAAPNGKSPPSSFADLAARMQSERCGDVGLQDREPGGEVECGPVIDGEYSGHSGPNLFLVAANGAAGYGK